MSPLTPGRRRALRGQLGYGLLLPLLVVGYALAAAALAAALQSPPAEPAPADVILVVAPQPLPAGLADAVAALVEAEYAPLVQIGGAGGESLAAALSARGLAAEQLRVAPGADLPIAAARDAGLRRALLVTPPADLLLGLKMARDAGLQAEPAPAAAAPPLAPADLVAAALRYWSYALVRR